MRDFMGIIAVLLKKKSVKFFGFIALILIIIGINQIRALSDNSDLLNEPSNVNPVKDSTDHMVFQSKENPNENFKLVEINPLDYFPIGKDITYTWGLSSYTYAYKFGDKEIIKGEELYIKEQYIIMEGDNELVKPFKLFYKVDENGIFLVGERLEDDVTESFYFDQPVIVLLNDLYVGKKEINKTESGIDISIFHGYRDITISDQLFKSCLLFESEYTPNDPGFGPTTIQTKTYYAKGIGVVKQVSREIREINGKVEKEEITDERIFISMGTPFG